MKRLVLTGAILLLFVYSSHAAIAARAAAAGDTDWSGAFENAKRESPGFAVESVDEFRRMTEYHTDLLADGVAVHSFRLAGGDAVQCVDVLTQRSLAMSREPLQFAPGTLPGGDPDAVPSLASGENQFGLDGSRDADGNVRACPERTFPRLMLRIENLYRFRRLDDFFRKSPWDGEGASATVAHEYAHASQSVSHIGTTADFNLWSPTVEQSGEFSLSQLWEARGQTSDNSLQTVETGWQNYRDLYGDTRSHLFIYYTTGNYQNGTGCYNLSCSGFVQTDNSVVIGGGFANYSTQGGSQYHVSLAYFRDPSPPNHWWLRYGGSTWVGYYPNSLFDAQGIAAASDRVDVGGEIINLSTGGVHTTTDMGSGRFPGEGFGAAAFTKKIQYWSPSNSLFDATSLSRSVTNASYYDLSLSSSTDTAWRRYFYFGGPGRAATIRVTSPNGGQSWPAGTPQTITWTSSNLTSSGQLYVLFSKDGGQTDYPTPIAILSPGATSHSWTPTASHATTAGRVFVGNLVSGTYEASDWSDQNFTVTSASPPSNDSCANATTLTSGTSCNSIAGTVLNATASGLSKPGCDGASSPNMFDVWYKFTAVATTQTITVDPAGSIGDPVLSVYSSCNGSAIACGDSGGTGGTEVLTVNGLSPGTTYYVRMYDYGTSEPAGTEANFQICVTGTPVTNYTLTITGGGSGSGTVTGNGINCTISGGTPSGTCSANYPSGTSVPLTATPSGGSSFTSWGNACAGSGACTVAMTANRTVSASFAAAPGSYSLTVTGGGTGSGTVTGTSINCTITQGSASGTCSANYASGTVVSLTASAAGGSNFTVWGNACSGSSGCSVTMSANRNVSASFAASVAGRSYYSLTPCRLIDTRNPASAWGGPALAATGTRNVMAAGQCGIPYSAVAVAINITAVSPAATGWLTVFGGPSSATRPPTSTLNYRYLKTRANNAITVVGADGTINVYNGGTHTVDFLIDVNGYFQ